MEAEEFTYHVGQAALAKKLSLVSQDIGFIEFDKTNAHFKYSYASAAGVIQRLNKAMAERGLIATVAAERCEFQGELALVHMTLEFTDTDTGASLQTQGVGCGKDSGDKGPMKASTAAYKYAIAHAFTLGWGAEDPEADSSTDKKGAAKPAAKKSAAAKPSGKGLLEEIAEASEKDLTGLREEIRKQRTSKDYEALKEAFRSREAELNKGKK